MEHIVVINNTALFSNKLNCVGRMILYAYSKLSFFLISLNLRTDGYRPPLAHGTLLGPVRVPPRVDIFDNVV